MNILEKIKDEKKTREIEKNLANALYEMSSLSSFCTFEEMIKTIADSDYGALSEAFGKISRQVKSGQSIQESLRIAEEETQSELFRQSLELLILGYETGTDIAGVLRKTADFIVSQQELEKQKSISLIVHKYSLLLAGGIIIPVILGLMLSVISQLNLAELADLGLGLSVEQKTLMLANSMLGTQIYVVLYALITGVFIGLQENSLRKTLAYAAVLTPAATLIFQTCLNAALI